MNGWKHKATASAKGQHRRQPKERAGLEDRLTLMSSRDMSSLEAVVAMVAMAGVQKRRKKLKGETKRLELKGTGGGCATVWAFSGVPNLSQSERE